MKIQKAGKKEFDLIFNLIKELWPNEKFNEINLKKVYFGQLANGKLFLIAKEDQNAIGLISLSTNYDLQNQGKVGVIDEMIVSEKFRGMGVGKRLLDEISKEAKKRNCLELQLHSNKKRKKTHDFYVKNKFNKSGFFFWRAVK